MAKRKPLSKLSKGTLIKRLREARELIYKQDSRIARYRAFADKHDYLVRTLKRAQETNIAWWMDVDVNRVLSYFKTQSTEGEKTP